MAEFRAATDGMLSGADLLLESGHPILRLDRWLDLAQAAGCTEAERHKFVTEARRIVTVWGPPVNDYSARIWSGLIRDYYMPRIDKYFDCKAAGVSFDWTESDSAYVFSNGISPCTVSENPVSLAVRLVDEYSDFGGSDIQSPDRAVAFWSPFEFGKKKINLFFSMPADEFVAIKGFKISAIRGSVPVTLSRVRVAAAGYTLSDVRDIDRVLEIGRAHV